ncbi:MAG: hypothetical protein EHM81_12675 [Chloroflexi bacterium]|nr:MAG: hypothetical protein EHM81_12675 [Chloroflexota bacterium]
MIFPEWNTANILFHLFAAGMAISTSVGEYLGLTTLKYSKFRAEKGIDSRAGMFFLYFTPLAAALGLALPYIAHPGLIQAIVLAATCGHFAKRCLEVLFVHKYSGPMDVLTTLAIGSFYTFIAAALGALNARPLSQPDPWFWLGLVLFLLGETVNLRHHKILADFRKDTRDYVLPRGGWFDLVACPHYLFEIIAWVGIAFMSRHLFAWIALIGMAGYLLARSLKTLAWYRQKFPGFPRERKALIPYIL